MLGTRPINDGLWHHVAAVFRNDASPDVTDILLYVDGVPDPVSASSPATLDPAPLDALHIGTDLQGRFFTGTLDELRLESRAADPAEIATWVSESYPSAAAWQRRYFGDSPDGWEADHDHDGASSLLEYAFGGQPWIADPGAPRLVPTWSDERLTITFPRRLEGTSELLYKPEVSTDLLAWRDAKGRIATVEPTRDRAGFEEVSYSFDSPVPETAAFFARLRVALAPPTPRQR